MTKITVPENTSFHHARNVGKRKKENYTFAIYPTDTTIFVGIAKCSKRDQFDKAKGRMIAVGRAVRCAESYSTYEDETVKWSLALDREHFGLTGPRFKREVVALVLSEVSELSKG